MAKSNASKYTPVHYHSYLELDKILNAQHERSGEFEAQPAHEEMLFIIVHQAYELWFKQIIHELASVAAMFRGEEVDERSIGTAVGRLNRVIEIEKLLIQQISVLETMTPLDFLDFRSYLVPASGFQSFQFRKVEVMLGLPEKQRMTYNNKPYHAEFPENQQLELAELSKSTLFDLLEDWLERTPFLQLGDFDFLEKYRLAVQQMLAREREALEHAGLPEASKNMRLQMLSGTNDYFQAVLNPEAHAAAQAAGSVRLSYRASVAALFIHLYRDEPILHMPFNLLQAVSEIDELLTAWRYRHAQMVLRMLGRKVGTGGSSGHEYLHATAVKHHIFNDLHNISTLLIPRSDLPKLPAKLRRQLGFVYSEDKS